MSNNNITNLFPFSRVKIDKINSKTEKLTVVKITPDKRYSPICSGCLQKVKSIHSYNKRVIYDLSMSGSRVEIEYTYRTVYCNNCGIKVEHHDFVDPFHVIASFSKVIDKIRAGQYRDADPTLRKLMKRSRFLLLKNPENLNDKERPRLKKILRENELLSIVYLLKDYLKRLWQYKYSKWAG